MNKTLKAFAVVGDGYEDSPEQLPVAATDGVQLAVFATIPSATERLEFKGEQVLPVVILSEKDHDARNAKYEQLQQCLTAADELADTMGGLLRLARGAIGENQWTLLTKDIDTMLSQDAGRTNNSRNAHCPHDGICHTSEETCADAQERIASLTAPAGAGQ
ncbi:hypothetical protein [Pseudomonas sp. GXZC]|uniref:hypothetical protein n=1 Tax=Pseudomonas sp. GXZC TaxID=3003351 RepID=UPI0022AA4C42|nr:hypothetical protein [Pseudomonas sp. GXZC]WAT30111.1 hypothetical protein OZ428_07175 [Pseudomonas sp. GXZC]